MQSLRTRFAGGSASAPRMLRASARLAVVGIAVLAFGSASLAQVSADEPDGPMNTGASNGGIATASSGGEITIGQIITGENSGNSIVTGNITGAAELHGGEIDYPTDVNVSQDSTGPIALANGGEGGTATGPESEPPVYNVDIKNNNRSNAKGIGEGGAGGTGGSGGDVVVNPAP